MLDSEIIRKKLFEFNTNFMILKCQNLSKDMLREYFSEDIVFHMPYGYKPLNGIDQLYERIQIEQQLFDHYDIEMSDALITFNRAALSFTATLQNKFSDDLVAFNAVQIVEFNEDYKICHKEIYIDQETLEHGVSADNIELITGKEPLLLPRQKPHS